LVEKLAELQLTFVAKLELNFLLRRLRLIHWAPPSRELASFESGKHLRTAVESVIVHAYVWRKMGKFGADLARYADTKV